MSHFFDELGQRIKRLPGVKDQGAVQALPLTSSISWGDVDVEGYTPPPSEPEMQVDRRIATPGYFETMKIPVVAGRSFADTDTVTSQLVAVVDEKMSQRFWQGDAVGKRVRLGSRNPWLTIVGVVGVVKQYGLDQNTRMVVYVPHKQRSTRGMYLVARTTSDPASLAAAMISEVHAIDPDVPVYDVSTMEQRLYQSLARRRLSTAMLLGFACFALILAAVGVYGVLSYLVGQGTRDIGVRIALGAERRTILALVMRQGMSLALIGVAAGMVGAVSLTRVMASLLYGVSATDLLTFVGVAILLILVAAAACYIPARRAMRVDPMVALRCE